MIPACWTSRSCRPVEPNGFQTTESLKKIPDIGILQCIQSVMFSPNFRPVGILDTLDPGECLRKCFQELKRHHPGASHRYIAAAIGLKSSASFTLLINGRIHPTPRIIDALARVFGLDRRERDHLSLLFELRRMRDPSARSIVQDLVRARAARSEDDAISGR